MAATVRFAHDGAHVHPARKLGLLASLYFSQGLPFGFFSQALPVLLRRDGVSLAVVGSTALLAIPWMLKFLWAPLVDRYGSARFGARRVWILPLQAAGTLLLLWVSTISPAQHLPLLFAAVLVANLIAATQDIATDALAVDLLSEGERGLGNGVQVAGYRVGMIVGGGLLLLVFDELGWQRTFFVLAALLSLASLPVWLHRERPRAPRARQELDFLAIFRVLGRPDVRRFLPVLCMYKAGDAFGTSMLRPFLVDRGQTLSEIGFTLGTLGFVAGLVGALAGGTLASRMARRPALVLCAALHALSLGLYAVCAAGLAGERFLQGAIVVEHTLGGMATAALFTAMMDHTRAETTATDYTVQASLVLAAGGLCALPSGFIAERLAHDVRYGVHFALAVMLGLMAALVTHRALRHA